MNDTGHRTWCVFTVAFLGIVAACTDRGPSTNPDVSAAPAEDTKVSIVERAPLDEYRIRYRVTELDLERTETVEVRRPYLSRRTSRRDNAILDDRITNSAGLWAAQDGGWQLLSVGRRLAADDERVLGSLELLTATGLAERLPDGKILDRRCTRFRTREPVGIPAVAEPTDDDHVEFCVDPSDVVLEETWTLEGTVIRHRAATAFEADPGLLDGRFKASPILEPPAGAFRTVEINPTSAIEDDLITHVAAIDDLQTDGDVVTVQLDHLGQPVDGTVIRFFKTEWAAATVEEVETNRFEPRGQPIETPLGEATRTVTLNLITVAVDIGEGVSLILAGPDPELIDRILHATVVDHGQL